MVLKVKEIIRIKYKILNMKIKHRIFRSRALYSRFVYSTEIFLSVFCAPGVVLRLEVRMVNSTDQGLAFQWLAF